jgi:hypothetical protein
MGHLAKLLDLSGPNGGPVEVTDYRARIMDRLNAIAKALCRCQARMPGQLLNVTQTAASLDASLGSLGG